MEKEVLSNLKRKGVYFTFMVKELVNVLTKSDTPMSFKEILKEFERRKFYPYTSTLYRQMSRLVALEAIQMIVFSDGIKRYIFVYKDKKQLIFRCRKCMKVNSIEINNSKPLSKKGFNVFVSEGLCKKCDQ